VIVVGFAKVHERDPLMDSDTDSASWWYHVSCITRLCGALEKTSMCGLHADVVAVSADLTFHAIWLLTL